MLRKFKRIERLSSASPGAGSIVSLNRYAVKRDAGEPAVIDALEAAGWQVWQLDVPCDLLCWKEALGPGTFKTLEVKTGYGRALKPRVRKDQQAQTNFIAITGTPIVRTPQEALRAVGESIGETA